MGTCIPRLGHINALVSPWGLVLCLIISQNPHICEWIRVLLRQIQEVLAASVRVLMTASFIRIGKPVEKEVLKRIYIITSSFPSFHSSFSSSFLIRGYGFGPSFIPSFQLPQAADFFPHLLLLPPLQKKLEDETDDRNSVSRVCAPVGGQYYGCS